jgi:hypothetical protein
LPPLQENRRGVGITNLVEMTDFEVRMSNQ